MEQHSFIPNFDTLENNRIGVEFYLQDMNRNKWDLRFLDLAEFISKWSKDSSTKVGAVITDDEHRVVSTGYNGFPRGTDDSPELYNNREIKYSKIVHGEINALIFAGRYNTDGCTLYTHPFGPCDRCASTIIQYGIKRVVFKKTTVDRWVASIEKAKSYFLEAGIEVCELV